MALGSVSSNQSPPDPNASVSRSLVKFNLAAKNSESQFSALVMHCHAAWQTLSLQARIWFQIAGSEVKDGHGRSLDHGGCHGRSRKVAVGHVAVALGHCDECRIAESPRPPGAKYGRIAEARNSARFGQPAPPPHPLPLIRVPRSLSQSIDPFHRTSVPLLVNLSPSFPVFNRSSLSVFPPSGPFLLLPQPSAFSARTNPRAPPLPQPLCNSFYFSGQISSSS